MKDIITSISGLIALLILVYCMFTGADFEATIWKTVVIFVATNLIGYAAMGLTSVTMKTAEDEEELDSEEDYESMETENVGSEKAAMNI